MAARTFYEGILGLLVHYEDPGRGVYYRTRTGTMLNLYERDAEPHTQAAATFLVDDLATTMSGLRERGVLFLDYNEADLKTQDGIFEDGTGFKVCWFHDTDGNLLSLEQLA